MDTGWVHVGLGENIAGSGSDWINPDNISGNSGTYAQSSISPGGESNYLRGTQFGFSSLVPAGARIVGVELKLSLSGGSTHPGSSIETAHLYLVKNGMQLGSDKSVGAAWPYPTVAEMTWGGATDLWGATLTAADVRDSTFGFEISAHNTNAIQTERAYVYEAWMKIYYEPSSMALAMGADF